MDLSKLHRVFYSIHAKENGWAVYGLNAELEPFHVLYDSLQEAVEFVWTNAHNLPNAIKPSTGVGNENT
jgi:hypothetical protein